MTLIEECEKYGFAWDFTEFLKSGKWFKKFNKCVLCINSHSLNEKSGKCLPVPNCMEFNDRNECI